MLASRNSSQWFFVRNCTTDVMADKHVGCVQFSHVLGKLEDILELFSYTSTDIFRKLTTLELYLATIDSILDRIYSIPFRYLTSLAADQQRPTTGFHFINKSIVTDNNETCYKSYVLNAITLHSICFNGNEKKSAYHDKQILLASNWQSSSIVSRKQKHNFPPFVLLLFLISLIHLNDSSTCFCFDNAGFNGDTSLFGSSYRKFNQNRFRQQTIISYFVLLTLNRFSHLIIYQPLIGQFNGNINSNNLWVPQSFRSNMRQTNGDSMSTLPTMLDSFSQDQSSEPAQSWTSIFNPFGLGISNPRPQQPQQQASNDSLDFHIKKILVPRVSGTQGNIEVREYIINSLKNSKYHVELDEFTSNTPIGTVKFANIIASSNPKACRQLVLACHYDSKMMNGFLGATDSAVPCAMLLKISEKFEKSFRAPNNDDEDDEDKNRNDQLGLRFIFFDGEEAFVQWSSTDSLYGSRHLAAKWASQKLPTECQSTKGSTELDRIELFVLLDLIGASDSSFVMYSTRLRTHYDAMQKYERAYLTKNGVSLREVAFKGRIVPLDFVEDDHVPFKKRGVPILLLLAHPFPRVWHTINDNYNAIDFPRTRRITHVIEEFVANYPNGRSQTSK